MSNTSIVIVVTTPRTSGGLTALVKSSTSPREELRALVNYFRKVEAGNEPASITVQTSTSAPVLATGTATVVYASLSAADTVTIAGTVLTCSTTTQSTTLFKKITDGTTTAANLATCINANTTLNKIVSATSAAAVVTIKCLVPGTIGNLITLASSASGVTVGSTLTTGAGGANTVPVTYSRGL